MTAVDEGAGAPEALARVAPGPAGLLARMAAAVPAIGRLPLAATARQVCAETLGLEALPAPGAASEGPGSRGDAADPSGRAAAAASLAEQFSLDVSAMPEGLRDAVLTGFGADTRRLLAAVYIADWVPRVRRGLDALLPGGQWPQPEPFTDDDPWPLIDGFMIEVARLPALDALTTELVRLRGARQHNCRRCKSLRSRSALTAGGDEAVFAQIDDYEHSAMPARRKAALAWTDALIWQPGYLSDDTVRAVREHFTAAESVELTLDVMRNACNKIAVAAGSDAANVTEGVELYDVLPDGTVAYGNH